VYGRYGVSESADGNVIDPGFSKITDGLQSDSSRRFDWNTTVHHLNGSARIGGREVVEKNDIRTRIQRRSQLRLISYFNFDLDQVPQAFSRLFNRAGDRCV